MALLRLDQACLAFGENPLLNQVDLSIEEGEKIVLLGRNGAGKSTLMRVLAGTEKLDSGTYTLQTGIRVQYLTQDLPKADDRSVFDYMAESLAEMGQVLKEYEALTHGEFDDAAMKRLEVLQSYIEKHDGWALSSRIESSLAELNLTPETLMGSLSGGWRRRVAIARSLLSAPDILLMDEPTNHLDIPAIEWLKKTLQFSTCSLILITHDRRLMKDIANKIWWLDRGKLTVFPGNYENYLTSREELLQIEERQNALFDKRLAEEEKWIRQGIKARRTRNEGRVRALKAMRLERSKRVDQKGQVAMRLDDSKKSGKLIAELENVSFSYQNKALIKNANVLIQRGDKVGIIGRNGAGKTTLLKLILGQLEADSGAIRLGTKQEVAYFDQLRDQLDDTISVADNVSGGRDSIEINGQNKHIIGYLGDFLFSPQRALSPTSSLSGGEKNRLLLAKLFSKQANILVLDEPSNDLDVETLELLEELIANFSGTVIVISHDREFVDQIVSSTIFIDNDGQVFEYVGGFDDLIRQHGVLWRDKTAEPRLEEKPKSEKAAEEKAKPVAKTKLSYKLQRELEALPQQIEQLEKTIQAIEEKMAGSDFYQQDAKQVSQTLAQLSEQQVLLEQAFERWQELDNMA